MNEGKMEAGAAYAICSMSDIPSQQARGSSSRVEEDGTAATVVDFRAAMGPAGFRLCQHLPA